MGSQSDPALSQAYSLIENCQLEQAQEALSTALTADLENGTIMFAIKCCSFWADILDGLDQLPPFEQGETLVTQWKQFASLFSQDTDSLERVADAFRRGVYSKALALYQQASDEKDARLHAEIYRKMGLCHKRLGAYEEALECLSESNGTYQGQAAVLAEMADCYDLCGEARLAKVLFREAFYVGAEDVDMGFLDSPLIRSLVQKVAEEGYAGLELQEWIPVYGVLLGVFNVKRMLRSQEVGKLKQDIYAKKNELKDPSNNGKIVKPRLINMYLWLMDYYVLSKESANRINEVLLEIRLLDEKLFRRYFSFDEKRQ